MGTGTEGRGSPAPAPTPTLAPAPTMDLDDVVFEAAPADPSGKDTPGATQRRASGAGTYIPALLAQVL